MRLAIFLTAIALVPASAQLGTIKQAPPSSVAAKPAGNTATTERPSIGLQTMITLEKEMDSRISATGGADPCFVQGLTRGLYIAGFGAIFTAEVELAATPGGTALFQTTVGAEQKAKYHKNKLAHVPLLEQTMRDVALSLAASPALKLGDNDQLVVAVRLVYRSWEDMTGLPGQIIVRGDRRGNVQKPEVQ